MGNTRKPLSALGAVGIALMMAILYLLSIGPFFWLFENVLPEPFRDTLKWAYWPVFWLKDQSELLRTIFYWYAHLWINE